MIVPNSVFLDALNARLDQKPIFIIEIAGYHYALSNGLEDSAGIMHSIDTAKLDPSIDTDPLPLP